MGTFPFDEKFLPVVKNGDYITFLPQSGDIAGINFQVQGVEPIQPFLIDGLQISNAMPTGVTALAANGTANDRSNFLGPEAMRRILEVDQNMFAQYRLEPVDDILIQLGAPGANSPLWATVNAQTNISKRLPLHHNTVQMTAAQATDLILWANSKTGDLAGLIAGQSPTRKARITGLFIDTSGATTITFGDGATAGGSSANSANHKFSYVFTAAGNYWVGRDLLPYDYYFESGIAVQQTGAVTTTVTVALEEDNSDIFSGTLVLEEFANANHSHEFYCYKNLVPSLKFINPTNYSQSTARFILAGFLFALVEAQPPAGVKPIGVPLLRLPRGGQAPS